MLLKLKHKRRNSSDEFITIHHFRHKMKFV